MVTQAAAEAGINRSVLHRIVDGSRPASREAMQKLVEWSGGEVSYEDFFPPLQPKPETRSAAA